MRQLTFLKLVLIFLYMTPLSSIAQNCGDVITRDVRLTSDLHCKFGYYILDVQADDVTIDLNGHTLSAGSSITAIQNSGYKNMAVKNGTI